MTSPAKLPAAAAGSVTDLFIVSQGCAGTPPNATGGATNSMSGAQLRTLAQGGLAPSATIDTTNASNINSGVLPLAQVPTIPTAKVSGLAASATTDTTNASNITAGTLANARLAVAAAGILGFGGPNPAAPASTTATMAGMGASPGNCVFTPNRSGRLLLMFTGFIVLPVNSLAGAGMSLTLYYGTGAAPANGAAVTGTAPASSVVARVGIAQGATFQDSRPFHLCAFVSGLAVGTAYWADIAQGLALAGSSCTINNVNFVFMEQ